jgi:DNA-binding MarR family transcriptional regulator
MSSRMIKFTADSKPRPADLLAEPVVAREALRKHDSEFLDQQISLEKSGALDVAVAETDTPQTRKQHWLNGYAAKTPVLTPKVLAACLGIAPQTATALLREMAAAGLIQEVTGRGSFRAFAI